MFKKHSREQEATVPWPWRSWHSGCLARDLPPSAISGGLQCAQPHSLSTILGEGVLLL